MSVKILVTIESDDVDAQEEADGLYDVIGGYADWPFKVEVASE